MNVDTLRTFGAVNLLLRNLEQNNIDIACIQETHNENKRRKYDNYHIYNGGAAKNKTTKTNGTNNNYSGGWPLLLSTILLYK